MKGEIQTMVSPVGQVSKLYAWGANSHGQLCLGHKEDVSIPTEIQLDSLGILDSRNIVQICGGGGHVAFLSVQGTVYTCGLNSRGQLGLGHTGSEDSKLQPVYGIRGKVTKLACGWEHTLCLTDDGCLWGWGANNYFQLGDCNKLTYVTEPTRLKIKPEGHIIDIAAGLRHSMAVYDSSEVFIWGSGRRGQLGEHTENRCLNSLMTPTLVQLPLGSSKIVAVACGSHHSLALCENGEVFVWGCNRYGQLAMDPDCVSQNRTATLIPAKSGNHQRIQHINAGWSHTIGISECEKLLVSWGRNDYGQLGRTGPTWMPLPVQLQGPLLQVSAGAEHNLGITSDRRVISWGWNEHGICGTGNDDNVFVPQPVEVLQKTHAILVGTGYGSSFAIVESADQEIGDS